MLPSPRRTSLMQCRGSPREALFRVRLAPFFRVSGTMADREPWDWVLIIGSMDIYRSSHIHLDRTEQLIEQSRKVVMESRALLARTRHIRFMDDLAAR